MGQSGKPARSRAVMCHRKETQNEQEIENDLPTIGRNTELFLYGKETNRKRG